MSGSNVELKASPRRLHLNTDVVYKLPSPKAMVLVLQILLWEHRGANGIENDITF